MNEYMAIPAITVLCYLSAEVFKALTNEKHYKLIPVLCAVAGSVLGVAGYLCFSGFIPAENPVVAAAIGVVSGWAATGVNQSVKQKTDQ